VFVGAADAQSVAAAARRKAAAEEATLVSIANNAYDDSWIDETLEARGVVVR
jgi:hypothetical protein